MWSRSGGNIQYTFSLQARLLKPVVGILSWVSVHSPYHHSSEHQKRDNSVTGHVKQRVWFWYICWEHLSPLKEWDLKHESRCACRCVRLKANKWLCDFFVAIIAKAYLDILNKSEQLLDSLHAHWSAAGKSSLSITMQYLSGSSRQNSEACAFSTEFHVNNRTSLDLHTDLGEGMQIYCIVLLQ